MGYLMPKIFLSKNSSGTIKTIARGIRWSITFPKGINLVKGNVIPQLDFKLAYHDTAGQNVSQKTMGTFLL